jgi:DNA-binding transcriptional regulator YiaG
LKAASVEVYDRLMPRKTSKTQKKDEALRLRKIREKLGLTQAELAAKFRVVPSAVNHWESGTRSIPGPVTVLIEIFEKEDL